MFCLLYVDYVFLCNTFYLLFLMLTVTLSKINIWYTFQGLERETLLLRPNDQHFVQLARKIGIGDFYNFFIHLGMEKADYENLNFRYFTNPMDFMLMGLFEWRDKTDSDQSTATFGKLLEALTAIERQHYLCQVRIVM